jgi:hypothetical protein
MGSPWHRVYRPYYVLSIQMLAHPRFELFASGGGWVRISAVSRCYVSLATVDLGTHFPSLLRSALLRAPSCKI